MDDPRDDEPLPERGPRASDPSPHGDPFEQEVVDPARAAALGEPPGGVAELGREAAAEALAGAAPPLPSEGLLSFYDRLRAIITQAVERRGFRLGSQVVEALLLVPDVFILLVRLALDAKVPSSSRALFGGAIAYFVLPVDLLPEAMLGAVGYLDDLVLGVAVLSHALGPELEPFARKYWSGSHDLRRTLADLARAGRSLLGESLYDRLGRLLARRGISLEDAERRALES